MASTADDWTKAEALARDYLKREKAATDPLEIYRFEIAPFLFGARWSEGDAFVVVFDGRIQTARGVALFQSWFAAMGEARIRGIPPSTVGGLFQNFDALPRGIGAIWSSGHTDQDLFPAIVEDRGVLKYVMHCLDSAPTGLISGSKAWGTFALTRWSLQLFPVVADLEWKREDRIERPTPPPPTFRAP